MMFGMVIAGRSLGWKIDPRLTVMLGYFATALGIYNLTRLSLDTSYGTATVWRMMQVIGLPFIFIPISTLNYVGVPRSKSNQISSLSNFARNMGGSIGTALLTTFLARTAQTHQQTLAAHSVPGSVAYVEYMSRVSGVFRDHGSSAMQSAQMAMGYAYQQLQRQASMLAYKNAFALLAVIIFILMPLPFIMRLPKKAEAPPPEEAMGH
jgi:DHA2 family multidrug resistance protein